jgi:hypothetical protein
MLSAAYIITSSDTAVFRIKAGVRSDDWVFEEIHLLAAEKVLLRILEREPSIAKGQQGDTLTEAINTPKGHCLEAFLNYCLRQVRLYNKRKEPGSRFWKHIQHVFDSQLSQCRNDNFEFSALAGAYLPNLIYLNQAWVTRNINKIFSNHYEANWRCAMEGYAYVNKVHKSIYDLLKKHGHFEKALDVEFEDALFREKIIQSITVGYLRGNEKLTGSKSLFAEILRRWNQKVISEVISFFWMLRDTKLDEQTRQLVLDFWKWCYEKISGHEDSNTQVLADLNLLTVFLREVSEENKKWLLQSSPFVDERHHSSFLLEYLEKLVDQSPEEVAAVYLQMLTRTTPGYREQDIRSIVEKLYRKGVQEKANDISNHYARKGYPELLRDIYKQHIG